MITKVALLCAILLAVNATGLHGPAFVNTGESASTREQDAHGNYAFAYDIVDKDGASNSRSEVGDAYGNKKGSYSLHDVDGRTRLVNYIADEHGFRVAVSTNEPGTANSAPADAIIDSPYPAPEAPVAPVAIAHTSPFAVAPVPVVAKSVAAPVAVVPQISLPVSHVAPAAFSSKSVINHVAPVTKFGHIAPATLSTKSYVAPVAHSPKAFVTPVTYSATAYKAPIAPVVVPYKVPTGYYSKSGMSHASPFAHSSKSLIPQVDPFTVSYGAPTNVAGSVVSHASPFHSQLTTFPYSAPNYKSLYNKGLRFGVLNHGLIGHRLKGLTYNSKMNYGYEVLGHNPYNFYHEHPVFNHGLSGYHLGGISYPYRLKSFHY